MNPKKMSYKKTQSKKKSVRKGTCKCIKKATRLDVTFGTHFWIAFWTISRSALCPRRCVSWVAKQRRLMELLLAVAVSRSDGPMFTATPPPEANHHIFFGRRHLFVCLFRRKGRAIETFAGTFSSSARVRSPILKTSSSHPQPACTVKCKHIRAI